MVDRRCTSARAQSAIVAIVALWRRRYPLARVAAARQVSFILWGWALSQYPYILPTTLTIREAAAPRITLRSAAHRARGGRGHSAFRRCDTCFRTFAGRAQRGHADGAAVSMRRTDTELAPSAAARAVAGSCARAVPKMRGRYSDASRSTVRQNGYTPDARASMIA